MGDDRRADSYWSAFWLRRIDGRGLRSGPHGIERNTLFTQTSP